MWPGLEQAHARGPEEMDPGEGATCPPRPAGPWAFPAGPACLRPGPREVGVRG